MACQQIVRTMVACQQIIAKIGITRLSGYYFDDFWRNSSSDIELWPSFKSSICHGTRVSCLLGQRRTIVAPPCCLLRAIHLCRDEDSAVAASVFHEGHGKGAFLTGVVAERTALDYYDHFAETGEVLQKERAQVRVSTITAQEAPKLRKCVQDNLRL